MTTPAGFVTLFQQACDISAEFLTVGRFHFVYGRTGREMDPLGVGIQDVGAFRTRGNRGLRRSGDLRCSSRSCSLVTKEKFSDCCPVLLVRIEGHPCGGAFLIL